MYGKSQSFKLRKHAVQMTAEEKMFAKALVNAIERVNVRNGHLLDEMKKDNLTVQDVLDAVRQGDVVEVNSLGRAVVRHARGTVVVVNLRNHDVVTAWYNRPTDQHKTLRMSEYTWKVNVVEYLRTL